MKEQLAELPPFCVHLTTEEPGKGPCSQLSTQCKASRGGGWRARGSPGVLAPEDCAGRQAAWRCTFWEGQAPCRSCNFTKHLGRTCWGPCGSILKCPSLQRYCRCQGSHLQRRARRLVSPGQPLVPAPWPQLLRTLKWICGRTSPHATKL